MGMWSCICCVVCWTVVVWVDWLTMLDSGTCTVICSDMITLYGSCLLWDVWLSGLWWSGLILYSLGYIWVSCGNVFFYVCQSGSYAEHFFLIYVVGRVWFFDCVVYRACVALLLIYPSVLVWYRWVGVLLIFAPFRFCRKGWMWFNCTLTGKIARYDTRSIPK